MSTKRGIHMYFSQLTIIFVILDLQLIPIQILKLWRIIINHKKPLALFFYAKEIRFWGIKQSWKVLKASKTGSTYFSTLAFSRLYMVHNYAYTDLLAHLMAGQKSCAAFKIRPEIGITLGDLFSGFSSREWFMCLRMHRKIWLLLLPRINACRRQKGQATLDFYTRWTRNNRQDRYISARTRILAIKSQTAAENTYTEFAQIKIMYLLFVSGAFMLRRGGSSLPESNCCCWQLLPPFSDICASLFPRIFLWIRSTRIISFLGGGSIRFCAKMS